MTVESRASTDEALAVADRAMDRLADGDEAAFDEVYRVLAPRLRRFLLRLSGSQAVADDLAQETLLRVHSARGAFAKGRPVAPWAYAIARNCHVSYTRSAQHRMRRQGVESLELIDAGPSASGEANVLAREAGRVVEKALAAMTEARREAFILLRYEGLSVADAARVVGVSEAALKVRAFHAYESIRAALADAARPSAAGERRADETRDEPMRTSGGVRPR